jgi:hypothetical protein
MQSLRKSVVNNRGGAGLSAVIALAIVGACVFVGAQLIPIYWGHWNLEDDLKTLVQFASVNYSGQDIKTVVLRETKKALDELGAVYKDKDVKIQANKTKIVIDLVYTRPHKVPFLTNPLLFDIHAENTTL